MSDQDPSVSGQTYRIGAVSRLTGIPADTLRVWERRYHAVTPIRSDAGTRLYASEDVGRLTLIKRLVDRGDAISSVANLTLEHLRERARGIDVSNRVSIVDRPCRLVVYGPYLADRLRQEETPTQTVELIGCFSSPEALLAASFDPVPDVVVLEFPAIHNDHVRDVMRLFAHTRATRAILVYGFASRSIIRLLDSARMITRRAPVDIDEIYSWCVSPQSESRIAATSDAISDYEIRAAIPARRFSDAELARISATSSAGECECPRHLVDLVSALTAFESYSGECEIRLSDAASMHAYFHSCAAHARALIESALERAVSDSGMGRDGKD